jgi:hypothetical protein
LVEFDGKTGFGLESNESRFVGFNRESGSESESEEPLFDQFPSGPSSVHCSNVSDDPWV